MKDRRRHTHLRILFMDFRMFWRRFILRRSPYLRTPAAGALGPAQDRVWKPR